MKEQKIFPRRNTLRVKVIKELLSNTKDIEVVVIDE